MSGLRSSLSLENLLDEPFGPFPEAWALAPRVPSTTVKNPLVLKIVLLEARQGVITGLDECEPCQPGHDMGRFNNDPPVSFTGVLNIDNPSWLTSQAVNTIEEMLGERDHNARLAIDPEARRRHIPLNLIYQLVAKTAKKVQVIVRGIKSQMASFMQSNLVPNSLQLISYIKNPSYQENTSSTSFRRYTVASLHIATYERSRCYLRRWRLFRQLQELLALDAGAGKSFRDNRTPLAERTPEWFVQLYMRHKAYADEQRGHRIHYDSDEDSDIQSGTGGSLKPGHHHSPRHVSREEIRVRFERDGEWINGQATINQQGRWLDRGVWAGWLEDRRSGQSNVPGPECSSLDGGGKLRNLSRKPSRHRPKATKRKALRPIIISRSPSPTVASDEGLDVDPTMMRTYDPDFSPASTTLGSPISGPSRPSTPVDPELLASLPPELWNPPNVSALLMWTCPWNGCFYTIDLLHLTDEDMDHPAISEDDKRRFRNQDASWDSDDVWAREAFAYMADKHHFWHLDQAGIDVDVTGDRYSFRWRHPPSHPRSPQLRRVKIDDRQPRPETVKREDTDTAYSVFCKD